MCLWFSYHLNEYAELQSPDDPLSQRQNPDLGLFYSRSPSPLNRSIKKISSHLVFLFVKIRNSVILRFFSPSIWWNISLAKETHLPALGKFMFTRSFFWHGLKMNCVHTLLFGQKKYMLFTLHVRERCQYKIFLKEQNSSLYNVK